MALSDYITPDGVRTCLGVSTKELPDAVVMNDVFLTQVLTTLDEIDADFTATYQTSLHATTPTDDQVRFNLLTQTVCTYLVALQLSSASPMFAPQDIKSDKTEIARASDAYKHLAGPIAASLVTYKRNLRKAYGKVNPAYVVPDPKARTLVTASAIAVDPVTG